MVDESTTTEHTPELRTGEIARAFGTTPELWTGVVPDELSGVALSSDDIRTVQTVGQLIARLYASKFDCMLSDTWDNTSVTGLTADLDAKYVTNDPAPLTSTALGTLYDSSVSAQTQAPGYAFFDFEDMPGLVLEDEQAYFEEDVRQEIVQRRRQSLFFEQAASQARRNRPAPRAQRRTRRLQKAVASPYPSPMGRAGSTLTPRTLRRPIQRSGGSTPDGALGRTQRLAIAAETGIPSLTQFTRLQATYDGEANESVASFSTDDVRSTPSVFIDDLAVSRAHLPGLAGAVEIAQTAFESASSSSEVSRRQRIGGVFSPGRLEDALKVVTLDPERRAAASLAAESELVPGYHRLMFDAAEQTWIAVESEGLPSTYDAYSADAAPRIEGRRVAPLTAQAMQIAASMPNSANAAQIARQAGPADTETSAQDGPIAAPIYAEYESASKLAARVAAFASRSNFTTAKMLNSGVRGSTATTPMGRAADVRTSLNTLVPAAKRQDRTQTERARQNHAAWLAEQHPTLSATGLPATTSVGIQGLDRATTTSAEVFAARQMLGTNADLSQLTRQDTGATSLAGEIRYSTHSWGGSYDDPAVYVSLESDVDGGLGLRNPAITSRRANDWNRVISMPLSSYAALQSSRRGTETKAFDASNVDAAPTAGQSMAQFSGITLRDGANVAFSSASALRAMDPTAGAGIGDIAPALTTTPISLPALATAALDSDGQYYYEMSYDVDAVLLDRFVDAFASSGHVEVKNGRIRQARPVNSDAAAPARPRNVRRTANDLARRTLLPSTAKRLDAQNAGNTDTIDGIRSASRRALLTGTSPTERGFPALSIQTQTARQPGVAIDTLSPAAAAVLAGAYDAEFSLLPPLVQKALGKHLHSASEMTAGGSGTGSLISRLANISDLGSPAARQRVLREMSLMGMDTPELLSALDGTVDAESTTLGFQRRDAFAPLDRIEPTSELAASEVRDKAMASIADDMIGVRGSSASENMLYRHEYFGDFAPAKLHRTSPAELLQHLLSNQGQGRPSSLAYGAELGEFMTLGSDGVGSKNIAAATATGRRKTSTGAPSQAARLNRSQNEAQRRLQHLKRQEVELASRVQGTTIPTQANVSESVTDSRAQAFERFADRVAGAVTSSLQTGQSVSVDASQYGWDGDSMTLAATTDLDGISTFSDRMHQSVTPWEGSTSSQRVGDIGASLSVGGLQSLGYDSDAHPLVAALREPDVSAPSSTAPLGGSGLTDVPALAAALKRATEGVRGFSSLGHGVIQDALKRVVMQRMPGGSLPGNLELAHSVLDRANGAFAGLDAGILEFLQSTAARGADAETRELRPGLDDWPEDSLEVLRQHGWGLESQSESTGGSGSDQRIRRLERRVDAAQEAYTRLSEARHRAQGTAPRSMDSVDWNLVQTGAARTAPNTADLGRLGATMVRSQSVPDADMSYVAPAVKMVAQQAQLKPTSEPVAKNQGGQQAAGTAGRGKAKASKPDIRALAAQIAQRLARKRLLERDRMGRS